jgi:integrase
MNQTARLTKKKIDQFTYAGGWDVRWDSDVTGFGVRIYPTGKKSFVLSYRSRGGSRRKRLMVIGPFGVLTLQQARELAKTHLAEVIAGNDPLDDKNRTRARRSVGELMHAYIETHAKVHKKTWKEDERRLKCHVPSNWITRFPGEITRTQIQAVHSQIGLTAPYEANRVLALFKTLFKFARLEGFVEETAPNPAEGIKPYKEISRDRYATEGEVKAFLAAIDTVSNIYIRALFWLYLLSGARKSELLARRWEDVDFENRRILAGTTKSGKPQFLPLNAQAIAILQAIPCLDDNPHVFPGRKQGCHLVNIGKAWRKLRVTAGVGDLRLHDLRRTVGSWMSQSGTELNTIKHALRHQDLSTTLIYARLRDDDAAHALEEHGKRVEQISGRFKPILKNADY